MAEQHRTQDQNRDKQQGSQSGSQQPRSRQQTGSPRRDNAQEVQQTQGSRNKQDESMIDDNMTGSRSSGNRGGASRDPQSIADDRETGADRSRRNFSSDRESDELGSEMSDEDLDASDDFGRAGGRSNR